MDFGSSSSADAFGSWGNLTGALGNIQENIEESRPLAQRFPAAPRGDRMNVSAEQRVMMAAQRKLLAAKNAKEANKARKELAAAKARVAKQKRNFALTMKRKNTQMAAAKKAAATNYAKKQKALANQFARASRVANRGSRASQAAMAAASGMNTFVNEPIGDPSMAYTHPELGSTMQPIRNLHTRPFTKGQTRRLPYRDAAIAAPMPMGSKYPSYMNTQISRGAVNQAMQGGRRSRRRHSRRRY